MLNKKKSLSLSEGKGNFWKKLLIIIGIVVVLAILAVAIPRITRYLVKSRSKAAQDAISEIRKSVDAYWQSNGKMSGFSLETAYAEAKLSKNIKKNWDIVVVWKPGEIYTKELVDKLSNVTTNQYVYVAPFRMIFATATEDNPIGEGKKVWFNGDNNAFHGYGIDSFVEPDWKTIFPNP
ncbi:MAG: hypothetical protein PHO32_05045 [Candidatus Cloacimonetes bacterium]|nr:hypothetical protein [Candidatus Cloacimonadota bacterium]